MEPSGYRSAMAANCNGSAMESSPSGNAFATSRYGKASVGQINGVVSKDWQPLENGSENGNDGTNGAATIHHFSETSAGR